MLVRWLSALVGAAILFGTTYLFGAQGIVYLSMIVVFVAIAEFAFLFSTSKLWSVLFISCSLLVCGTHIINPLLTLPALLLSFMLLASKGVVYYSKFEPVDAYKNIEWSLWGVIYCGLLPALALQMTLDFGWKLFYFLLITVFLGDSFALFTGMTLGGRKIFPKISPKKTVSGAIGGLVGSVLFGLSFIYFTSPAPISILQWVAICLMIGFFAQIGDFFESLVKRYTGKKDSGKLMPGHGGFLDRVDGVYFGSAILFLYTRLFDLAPYFH